MLHGYLKYSCQCLRRKALTSAGVWVAGRSWKTHPEVRVIEKKKQLKLGLMVTKFVGANNSLFP